MGRFASTAPWRRDRVSLSAMLGRRGDQRLEA
jgi:hypothetical protein